ncbi:MAG: hypothetical protein KJ658_12145, partial [Proteobacteria bacterium]|nr:hypothetical protein [Pseudomonadota bacterium]
MPQKNTIPQFQAALAELPLVSTQFSRIAAGIGSPGFTRDLDQWGLRLDELSRALLTGPDQKRTDLETVMEMISFLNEQVTCQIIQEAIAALEASDNLTPPCPFCWISMGSDAREEQVVRTDQDNALIYVDTDGAAAQNTDRYFLALAERIVQDLDRFGFRRCTGNVMAINPVWRRSLGSWLKALDQWVGSSAPEAVRQLTILMDFRAVYGDKRLARIIQARVFDLFDQNPSVSHFLARDDRLFASPKTLFGRIRTQRKGKTTACFNLKTNGLVHLINGARILAANHRIQVPSTLKRLQLLEEEQVLPAEEYHEYAGAFRHLIRLKFENHLSGQGKKNLPIHCIDVSTLNQDQRGALMQSLDAV